jgi:hypothetical protein
LFYRTLNGAQVGDLFMSLIHTCQLCDAPSFDYLTELQRHGQELAASPAEWMPWNYRQTLKRAGVSGVCESCLAKKDKLRPGGNITRKWPESSPAADKLAKGFGQSWNPAKMFRAGSQNKSPVFNPPVGA